ADDTRIHTQLLGDALRRDPQLEVINPPSRSRDLIEAVKLHQIDVVVVSSNLDEEPLRGFELLRELRASNPDIFAIMLLDSSKREMEVVRCLAEGLTNREIANRLGLSQHTIKNYLFRIYDKLGVSSRLELLFMTLTQAGAAQPELHTDPVKSANHYGDPRSVA